MKRTSLAASLLVALVFAAACRSRDAAPMPTALPAAPTPALTTPTDPPPTPTVLQPPTEAPPTAELVVPTAEPPTAEPPTTESPTAEPPTAEPSTAEPTGNPFAPGQMDAAALASGGSAAYLVNAVRFQPVVLFVEPAETLDIALDAYVGDQTGRLPEGGTPKATADNALAGRPELLVLSPDSDGSHTLIIRATGGEGAYTAHLYDLDAPAVGMVVQQADALAAGQVISYGVTSRGWRPVLMMARPTDGSDIAIDVLAENGSLLTTSNYAGPGSMETAYVLPLGTTTYIVAIREVNGGPSSYQVAVVAME